MDSGTGPVAGLVELSIETSVRELNEPRALVSTVTLAVAPLPLLSEGERTAWFEIITTTL
jgi:hypothetical protein